MIFETETEKKKKKKNWTEREWGETERGKDEETWKERKGEGGRERGGEFTTCTEQENMLWRKAW